MSGELSSAIVDPVIPDPRLRRLLFAACAVGFAILILTDVRTRCLGGPHPSDWIVYASASPQFFAPGDPYSHSVTPTQLRYIYPPLFALLIRPLTLLPIDVSGMIWAALSVAMLYGFYREWRMLLVAMRASVPLWLTIATTAAATVIVVATLQGGQVGLLNLYASILGVRLILLGSRAERWLGGIAMVLPAAIKLAPGLAAAILVAQLVIAARPGSDSLRRAVDAAAGMLTGVFLWFFAVPSLILGWRRNIELLASMVDHVAVNRIEMGYEWAGNQGMQRAMLTLAGYGRAAGWSLSDSLVARGTFAVAAVYLAIVLSCVVVLARRGSLLDHVAAFSVACAASLFLSPVTWHHHFTLAIPALGCLPLVLASRGRRAAARAQAGVATGSVLFYYSTAYFLPPLPTLGLGFAVATILFCAFVLGDRAQAFASQESPELAA